MGIRTASGIWDMILIYWYLNKNGIILSSFWKKKKNDLSLKILYYAKRWTKRDGRKIFHACKFLTFYTWKFYTSFSRRLQNKIQGEQLKQSTIWNQGRLSSTGQKQKKFLSRGNFRKTTGSLCSPVLQVLWESHSGHKEEYLPSHTFLK